MTTKIEQFIKAQFGIELLPAQLEIIAQIAVNPDIEILIQPIGKRAGKTTAAKAAMAWLQEGLKSADVPPVVMSGKFDKIKPRDRMGGF